MRSSFGGRVPTKSSSAQIAPGFNVPTSTQSRETITIPNKKNAKPKQQKETTANLIKQTKQNNTNKQT
jgi:hypothetical protein